MLDGAVGEHREREHGSAAIKPPRGSLTVPPSSCAHSAIARQILASLRRRGVAAADRSRAAAIASGQQPGRAQHAAIRAPIAPSAAAAKRLRVELHR